MSTPIAPVVFLAAGLLVIYEMYRAIKYQLIPALIELHNNVMEGERQINQLRSDAEAAVASGNKAAAAAAVRKQYIGQSSIEQFGAGYGHNAAGTDNWQGGMTWVGEEGPELLNLPRGSQVIPKDKVKSPGGVTINQTNHNYNPFDLDSANRELGWRLQVA